MPRSFKWFRSGLVSFLPSVLFIISTSSGSAQKQVPVMTQAPPMAGIAHAAIRVADLAKSRDFYEKLGFEEAFSMSKDGVPTQSFLKINDRQFIELYPKSKPEDPIGFLHVCFESTEIELLNQFYAERGLSPKPVRKAGAGNLLFTMEGPEQQNIEYTQYMPDSKHTLDQGKHLGPNRISKIIVAMGIEMQNSAAAVAFYREKLGFKPVRTLQPGQQGLDIPGQSNQHIEIVQHAQGSAFQLFFSVANLREAEQQLKSLHIDFKKVKAALWIQDPDGNRIVFVRGKSA